MTVLGPIDPSPADEWPYWEALQGTRAQCTLCYRRCTLDDGQAGPCGTRRNAGGGLEIRDYSVASTMTRQLHGIQDPFTFYKPHKTAMMLGSTHCTAACTFCASAYIVHKPDSMPWATAPDQPAPIGSLHSWMKAKVEPETAVKNAMVVGATSILFGINEPTLSLEYTFQVASIAKAVGMDVLVESNGFTNPAAIRLLAPVVDAVCVGVKGSMSPAFYARRMRSEGAVPAVKAALLTWQDAGVHTTVGDLIAPPRWQDDDAFAAAATAMYEWVGAELGPLTPVVSTPISPPGPKVDGRDTEQPLTLSAEETDHYGVRMGQAAALAAAAGLRYADVKSGDQVVRCHHCAEPLLTLLQNCGPNQRRLGIDTAECSMTRTFCPWWTVTSHAQDGHCDACGVAVPLVTMTAAEEDMSRAVVADAWERRTPEPPATGRDGEA